MPRPDLSIPAEAQERADDLVAQAINGNWSHVAGELLADDSPLGVLTFAWTMQKLDADQGARLIAALDSKLDY